MGGVAVARWRTPPPRPWTPAPAGQEVLVTSAQGFAHPTFWILHIHGSY